VYSAAIGDNRAVLVAAAGDTVLAVLLMVVLVGGYVLLWAIWRLFFRGAPRDGDAPGDADERR
jgi:hypothetical protein